MVCLFPGSTSTFILVHSLPSYKCMNMCIMGEIKNMVDIQQCWRDSLPVVGRVDIGSL